MLFVRMRMTERLIVALTWSWLGSESLDDSVFDVDHEVLCQEVFGDELFDSYQSHVILGISFFDPSLFRLTFMHDEFLTALWEIKLTEEEFASLFGALLSYIIGPVAQIILWSGD